jgi:protein-tyrosine-phosphatase
MSTLHERYNVLFLCTGNSARSILAESIMNRDCQGLFRAYSAGSHPKGEVHPTAVKLLESMGYPTDGLRSKSWDEFKAEGAPVFDFIVTVCDNADGEVCPIWPGKPIRSHWGIADPAAAQGGSWEIDRAFAEAHRQLSNRIRLFASLPIEKLDGLSIKRDMDAIGQTRDAPQTA